MGHWPCAGLRAGGEVGVGSLRRGWWPSMARSGGEPPDLVVSGVVGVQNHLCQLGVVRIETARQRSTRAHA